MAEETPSHMLFNCDRAMRIWLLSPFIFRPENINSSQLRSMWKELGTKVNGEAQTEATGLFATIGWHIWIARNNWVFNQKWTTETKVLDCALQEHHMFIQVIRKEHKGDQGASDTEPQRWLPPEFGVLKINEDGAFDVAKRRGGVGAVVRDHHGNVIGAAALPIACSLSAEMVEVEGIRFALGSLLCSWDNNYVVEGDAQSVIKMLQGFSPVKACLDVIIKDT